MDPLGYYFDNVLTKFIVNNTSDASKTDINLFFMITNCQIVCSRSLTHCINYKFMCLFSIKDGSFKSFENGTVKLSAKETKWTSLEVRTRPTFLETLISKSDFGPVKLLGLSRNGSQAGIKPAPHW